MSASAAIEFNMAAQTVVEYSALYFDQLAACPSNPKLLAKVMEVLKAATADAVEKKDTYQLLYNAEMLCRLKKA
jgi:hypothetical protein